MAHWILIVLNLLNESRDSSVSVVARVRAGRPRDRCWILPHQLWRLPNLLSRRCGRLLPHNKAKLTTCLQLMPRVRTRAIIPSLSHLLDSAALALLSCIPFLLYSCYAGDVEPTENVNYVATFVYPRLCNGGIGHPSFIVGKTNIVASSKCFYDFV